MVESCCWSSISLLNSAESAFAVGGMEAEVMGESVVRVRLGLGIASLDVRASFCSACTTSAPVTRISTLAGGFHCAPNSSCTSTFLSAGCVHSNSWALRAVDERARALPSRVLSTVAIDTERRLRSAIRSRTGMRSKRASALTMGICDVMRMGGASVARSSAKTCTTCLARTGEKLARSAARANGAMCLGGSRARNICVSRLACTYLEGSRKGVGERCLGLARCVELQTLRRLARLQRLLDPRRKPRRGEKWNALYALVWSHKCVEVAARL